MNSTFDPERRARELIGRRAELLRRLPRELAAARDLSDDARELAVDEAIEYVALRHKRPLHSLQELERTFWTSCALRVRRALEGRYDTVRAGFKRADEASLAAVAGGAEPVDVVLQREDLRLAVDFAAMLDRGERDVLKCKHAGDGEGYRRIARHLGVRIGVVRAAERAIDHKAQRFAAIYTAGRLCAYRTPVIASLAAGEAGEQEARVARAHLAHCTPCAEAYTRHVRYLRSAAFQRKVAALLPLPAATSDRIRGDGAGLRDIAGDWLARLLGHDPTTTATQLAASGAGRGAGTAAMLKLAAVLCITGGATCLQSGILPNPLTQHETPARTHTEKAPPARPKRPNATRPAKDPALVRHLTATPQPTPTPTPRPKRRRHERRQQTTQGDSGPTSHEQTPASPAPADAAPNGASEFDPTYQPSQPAQPAPVPAAPGSDEFF